MNRPTEQNVENDPLITVEAGETELHDFRGCVEMIPYSAGGVHTYQPADGTGTALLGTAADNFVLEEAVAIAAPFYLIAADAAEDLQLVRR